MPEQDQIVAKLDRARLLLAEASTASQAKAIMDAAHAAEIYAKRQKLSEEIVGHAHEIKIEAMARMGEFLKDMPKNTGAKGIGPIAVEHDDRNTKLADIGLTKNESSDAQFLATVLEDKPEDFALIRQGLKTVSQAKREAVAKVYDHVGPLDALLDQVERDILAIRRIALSSERLEKFSETLTTTEKGKIAQDVVCAVLKAGRFPIWFDGELIQDVEMQREGEDVRVRGKWRIQVKCDYKGGLFPDGTHRNATGNLFLQTAERNPLRRF